MTAMADISDLPMLHDIDADYTPQYVKLARVLRDKIESGKWNRRLHAHYLRRRPSLSIAPPLGGNPGRTGPTMPVPDQERPALSCSPAS
jgi:hypothetical protein